MATSVQIVGIPKVLEAFNHMAKDHPRFAVWQGKAMNFKYEGDDPNDGAMMLEEMLKMYSSATRAIYTLRFYDDSDAVIKSNTPDVGGFNFKINEDMELAYGGIGSIGNASTIALAQRLEKLEKAQQPVDSDNDGLPKWLDHPLVIGAISKILGVTPAAITGVSGTPSGTMDDRLDNAIDGLLEVDKDLVIHLEKLLLIAKNNPGQFNMLLKMLENF